MTDIVILSGARTAIGGFGGSLAGVTPIDLGATVAKAALVRGGVEADQIGTVTFGHVINTEPGDMYLSRVAAMQAGGPDTVPAMNVNRLCGSGVQAIVSVIQSLMLGDAEFGLAGGAESMSRAPYILPNARWGAKMGDVAGQDMMLGALNCPFGTGHMGITAENVAAEHDITRADQDGFALAKTGLSVGDFDVIESNEAFASQALAVNKCLGFDPAKVNPNGGAIALGHPVGATGAIITVKAMYELERIGGSKALITMCIGGGQGIALAIERI